MSELKAPAGARWDVPGWAEAELDDSAEVAALKAALESATQRAAEWQEAHNLLEDECEAQKKEIVKIKRLNEDHYNSGRERGRENFQWGFALGILAALAIFGALAWFGYV